IESFDETEQADEPVAEEAEVIAPPAPEAAASDDPKAAFRAAIAESSGFENTLVQLSPDQITELLVEMPNEDDRLGLYIPGVSNPEFERIHLEIKPDVARAARGLALAAAGGVDLDSQTITSNSGRVYELEGDKCYHIRQTTQPDLQGGVTTIEDPVLCKGNLDYKRVNDKFVPTGETLQRCTHQWAAMFALGYWVTVSRKSYEKTVKVEIAQRVGNDEARELAKQQIAIWREKGQENREVRAVHAQAINHVKNTDGMDPETGLIPSMPEILNQSLPTGDTLQQAIAKLNGSIFYVTFNMPVNGRIQESRVRARNTEELLVRIAPSMVAAKMQQGQLELLDVTSV
ncbi:MAG: hypothetical protein ACYSR6_10305, partial [Planctomycetota bacterium]